MKTIRWLICSLAILMMTSTIIAQGVPSQIDAALQALSQRVGQTLTLDNQTVSGWRWEQTTFGDTSLGCGRPDIAYAQVVTPGFIFFIDYQGLTYEYRVSQDAQIVRACNDPTTELTTPDATAESTEAPAAGSGIVEAGGYSNSLCPVPEADEPTYPRTRLTTNIVVNTTTQVPLRENPVSDAPIIVDMPPGTALSILAGPQCSNGLIWWQADLDGTPGWFSEVEAGDYTVQPQPADSLPQTPVITIDNVARLAELSLLQGNFFPRVDWSPDGSQLAVVGDRGLDSILVYTRGDLANPTFINQAFAPTNPVFFPDGTQILAGNTTGGGVHVWNVDPNAPVREALFLQTHRDVRVVALHPNGSQFASAGTGALTNRDVNTEFAIALWDIQSLQPLNAFDGHTAAVLNMAFSPDGGRLAAVDADGNLIVHPANVPGNSTPIAGLVARTVAYSANGQFLAVGNVDGSISLLDAETTDVLATLTGHFGEVTSVSFSPDTTLLASASADGTVRVWNTQSDELLAVLELTNVGGVFDVAFSPDGALIAATVDDNTVRVLGVLGN